MKTLKKWWKKFTTKTMSLKERFTKIIRDRLGTKYPNTRTAKLLTFAAVMTSVAIAIAVFSLVPIFAVLPASLIAWLPFNAWLSGVITFFVLLPVYEFVANVISKIVFFVVAPWYAQEIKPIHSLLTYPNNLIEFISFIGVGVMLAANAVITAALFIFLRITWLAETFVELLADLVETSSSAGFKANMKGWAGSWHLKYLACFTLADVMAEQSKSDRMEAADISAGEDPTVSPLQRNKNRRPAKMRPVTPATV